MVPLLDLLFEQPKVNGIVIVPKPKRTLIRFTSLDQTKNKSEIEMYLRRKLNEESYILL